MKNAAVGKVYLGTSGLLLPVANKTYFPDGYKDKSRLAYYASLFSSIEINSSFYKIPQASTVRKWRDQVPDHFRFTFKLFKGITHSKHLIYDPLLVTRFLDVISQAGNKCACLLLQFPAGLNVSDIENLAMLLNQIRSTPMIYPYRVALEFRHVDWYSPLIYDLAANYNCCFVIHDKNSFGTAHHDTSTNSIYIRFHGPSGNYRNSYDEGFLFEYASYIQEWLSCGKNVYVYFNNTMGNAVANLNTLSMAIDII